MTAKPRLVEIGRRQNPAAGTDVFAYRVRGSLVITEDTMHALWNWLEAEKPSRIARMLVIYEAHNAAICCGTLDSHKILPWLPRRIAHDVQRQFLSFKDPEKALTFLGVVVQIWLS